MLVRAVAATGSDSSRSPRSGAPSARSISAQGRWFALCPSLRRRAGLRDPGR